MRRALNRRLLWERRATKAASRAGDPQPRPPNASRRMRRASAAARAPQARPKDTKPPLLSTYCGLVVALSFTTSELCAKE